MSLPISWGRDHRMEPLSPSCGAITPYDFGPCKDPYTVRGVCPLMVRCGPVCRSEEARKKDDDG